jgi:Polyketide cyclase / dehydrase and lipid transport
VWEYEHAVETEASRDVLWRHWSDMASWPEWNAGIAKIEVDGPFAVGTAFTMVPPAGDPVRMRLTEIVPSESFTDEMDGGDFVVRTVHRLEALPADRTRVVYRTEIVGPTSDQVGPGLGPQITADFPDVLNALIRLAEDHPDTAGRRRA